MPSVKIMCECGKFMKEVDKIHKMGGNQCDQYVVAIYHLFACECGQTYWTKSE